MITSIENTDEYEIVGSGSLITYNQKPIRIGISTDSSSSASFIDIVFENNTNKPESEIHSVVENETMTLHLTNFNNSLGSGTKHPVRIGEMAKDKTIFDIFINFRVYGGNNTDKLFFYTLYAVKKPAGVKKSSGSNKGRRQ